jgi:hypothetical protein
LVVVLFNHRDSTYLEGFADSNTTINVDKKDKIKNHIKNDVKEKINNNTSTSISTNGVEGFDIIGRESTIKRGKQSKSIPVNDSIKASKHTEPFNGLYSDSYSQF